MAIDTQTQIGADGRRHPLEEPAAAPAALDAAEDTRARRDVTGTQIGPDGKRHPIDELEADADTRHVAGNRIDPGTQVTADGVRVARDEVDPNAAAPRFDTEPDVAVDAATADETVAATRDTVEPRFATGGEVVTPESVAAPAPEPGQLGGEDIGNESMPTSIPAAGTATDSDGNTVPAAAVETDDLDGKSKDELYEIATEMEIEGRSSMNKAELADAIRRAGAEPEGEPDDT